MKAIVANVLFGGILGCLSCANSTLANPVNPKLNSKSVAKSIASANFSLQPRVPVVHKLFNSFNSIPDGEYHQWLKHSAAISLNSPHSSYFPQQILVETDCSLAFCDREAYPKGNRPEIKDNPLFSQQPYVHKSQSADVALGFQSTFWASQNKQKYWGVTTVEHWGDSGQQLNLPQLDYINSPPILAAGSSTLTFSGGGNNNLVTEKALDRNVNLDREFKDFRGGITYHRGISKHLTMGVGFIYEDIFAGFTQLTYKSNILPITTTVSLLAKESDLDLHTHIRFQPSKGFVANYYHDGEQQKFDADLAVYPGLNLIASGNTKQNNYSTGIRVAIQNNYFSLTATAALDRERNLQWKLNSQIGRFKFAHSSNKSKTNSELSNQLVNSSGFGFQCSAFVKYQTRLVKQEQQEFMVWGGKFNSQTKVSSDRHLWSFDLGYGTSSHGKGMIANSSVALKPDLFLQLNYQEISAVSDETKIKLELSSK